MRLLEDLTSGKYNLVLFGNLTVSGTIKSRVNL